jgi:ketosteroid isomerase-like protein
MVNASLDEVLLQRTAGPYIGVTRSDEKFRVYGDFAVITGLAAMHAVVNGSEKQLRYRYTSIWHRRNRAWKMIMWQSTAVGAPH